MDGFSLHSSYTPSADQSMAIDKLLKSLEAGNPHQTLLGVTGSGKTFSAANIIARWNKPTLLISHNKTLAAQLYSELKQFFPENSVQYFVSYFDYYQPEAYIPSSDTYIEKDSSINDEIERMRLSTMGALMSRRDVIVVASVSCIYGLGSPEDYRNMMMPIQMHQDISREEFLASLVDLLFERNDVSFGRGTFRVRGDVVDIHPAYLENTAIRVEFFGDCIEQISQFDCLTNRSLGTLQEHTFFPAKQFVTEKSTLNRALDAIAQEANERVDFFEKNNKLIEAQRIRMRTDFDLEMLKEMGFCQGVENYSRHLTGRKEGDRPYTLLDFFPKDYLLLIDESHVSIPQIGGMYEGDKSRKTVLVEHGFRLPSALDNRPLRFEEFMEMTGQRIYISATPGPFEWLNSRSDNRHFIAWNSKEMSASLFQKKVARHLQPSPSEQSVEDFDVHGHCLVVEQIMRPTGLLDPDIKLRPLANQIDETIALCREKVAAKQRVLVTTLTKKTAEELSEYLEEIGLKVAYIHSDVGAVERVEILRNLRSGVIDILVGINLLREGLDLPEVALVCILDADKEGFLRNETSLVQTAGRAARHQEGTCILFCDEKTDSINALIRVSSSRRKKQIAYNKQHGITPRSVVRPIQESLHHLKPEELEKEKALDIPCEELIESLRESMLEASSKLDFEHAAHLRDQIKMLQENPQKALKELEEEL